jgi:hypothetical protein
MERVRHFHFHENDRVSDLHLPIQKNLDWWAKLLKNLSKKFPEAAGIIELADIKGQLESFNNLSKSLPKQSSGNRKRELKIPPIIT